MVWVYERTGSLLIAMLMHASLSGASLRFGSGDLSTAQTMASVLVWAGALWMVVAVVALATGWEIHA
jgi:hypothetical protein